MKKIFITGVSGFVGRYLAAELSQDPSNRIFGTYFSSLPDSLSGVNLSKVNLESASQVNSIITEINPDEIYHLAALTSTKKSFEDPSGTFTKNVSMVFNVLESVKKRGKKPKILIISSAEVYGKVAKENLPIDENTPFNPTNPYAVSKIAIDYIGLEYHLASGLHIVRVRPFNHTGPGHSTDFAVPSFARKIAQIEKGKLDKLTVGNLEAKRDFSDVRDIVKAYVIALDKGKSGQVYNIGSGKSWKIGQVLDILLSLSKTKIKVEKDPSLFMPADNPQLLCDYSKFHKETGWKPTIPLQKTLLDTLDYWRSIT